MKDLSAGITVDTRGLSCPMPVLETRKAMEKLAVGEVAEVLAADKSVAMDLPAWAKAAGHELIHTETIDGVSRFFIKKMR